MLARTLLTLLFAMVLGCSKGAAEQGPRARPPPLVVVSKVDTRDVPIEVRAPIELRALAQADVGSKTLGVLDAVFVDRGDKVRRGQLLALVRPSDLPDQLAAARGALSQTQASLSLAKTNLERAQKLAPTGVVSQQELQTATASVAQAEAAEAAQRAQVSALATRLGETRIDSPLDGVVAVRKLDPGAMVGTLAGAIIVTVVRIDTLRAFITVTERDIRGVRVGEEAHVELDALPGKSIEGKVVRVSPTLDPATRTLDAEVQIANPDGDLRPGMFGRGAIVTDTHPRAVIVPAGALQLSEAKAFVFVLEGDHVRRREIVTGQDEGTWLEVVSGLGEGEEIVTAGIDVLGDGMVVRVQRGVDPFTGGQASASTQRDAGPTGTGR
jgi:RND family efflux transporter MFP subunit